ncbi:C40 family peptidase [soil metagenome]
MEQEINATISQVKQQYAPDSRTAIFEIEATSIENRILIKGETNLPEAKKALLETLENRKLDVIDSINLLPATSLLKPNGLISISVANIRSTPEHSSELSTQLTLGMSVKILKEQQSWYLIQGPDQYIGWINKGVVQEFNQEEMKQWQESGKIIYTNMYGFAYATEDKDGKKVSDLVAGNILKLLEEKAKFYKAEFPDKRVAYLDKNESASLETWLQESANENQLVNTAFEMMGIPYLWGGTSVKGVDCSGFTKTIFFLNRQLIPRDASQQVEVGELIDETGNFENLMTGDLLFFGSRDSNKRERVVHVGMWIGNNEFIHASDRVMINSFDPQAANFDQYNLNRYLRTKRITSEAQTEIMFLNNSIN